MDTGFAESVRDLLATLAGGDEPPFPTGGALGHVLRETGAVGMRGAVGALADRWFRPAAPRALDGTFEPVLNRADVGEAEKLYVVLREHVVGQRRWQDLSSNESTFYRYRRSALATFQERLWLEVAERPFPSNRPRPEYAVFVGRRRELASLLADLGERGGALVGVEGPGGSGKTALLHAVADACETAARCWQAVGVDDAASVPLFDALVWVARSEGVDLAYLLETVARTLDYPGLLSQALEDRRQAVRDLLGRRSVLLVVDDVDQAESSVMAFLSELPSASRALVAARRRLPAQVRALMPHPLAPIEVRTLLLAEAERQGAPDVGRALAEGNAPEPLAAAARYPLLAAWAVGQLRRGQTVERVRERLASAQGEVFSAMFAASMVDLSAVARALLAGLPLLPAPANRAALLALGGEGAEAGLDELLETSLLEVSGAPTDEQRRYGLHAVTRSFVVTHLPRDPADERAAVARLATYYVTLAARFGGGVPNWRSFGRVESELSNLMAVVDVCAVQARERGGEPPEAAFDHAILRLAHGMRNVFWFGRDWPEGLALFHRAIEAARRLDDRRAEGWNTYRLGILHYELGTAGYAEAARRGREAAELLEVAGDLRGKGHALRLLGRATRERGKIVEAERVLAEAESLLRHYGHGDDVAIAQASRADVLRVSGRLDEATVLYEEVLRNGLDDPGTEANVRNDLGEIAIVRGELDRAAAFFATAERVAEEAGARAILARCLLGQARVAEVRGERARARHLAQAAADHFERLGDSDRVYEARALL